MRTFAYDGPVEWSSFADHLSLALAMHGHSQNLAWFVGHNTVRYAAGVFSAHATEPELRAMERLRRARRCTPARSASRPGSSSTRAAPRRPTSSSG